MLRNSITVWKIVYFRQEGVKNNATVQSVEDNQSEAGDWTKDSVWTKEDN